MSSFSAFTCKSATFGFCFCAGVFAVDVNSGSSTAAVLIIGAFPGFAVNIDFFTAAGIFEAVCCRAFIAVAEASAAGFVCSPGIRSCDFDFSSGTESVFVVDAGYCCTVKNCHGHVLLGLVIAVNSIPEKKDSIRFVSHFKIKKISHFKI